MDRSEGPGAAQPGEAPYLLAVYAMPGCPGWERALTLASLARDANLAGIEVRMVDLSLPEIAVPDTVVASPTWVLNGRRIALGNPDTDWLLDWLGALAAGRRYADGGSTRV